MERAELWGDEVLQNAVRRIELALLRRRPSAVVSYSQDSALPIPRWLMRGSVLQLLVAVPSHVMVRDRGDCCAPLGAFWGITTGLSVMLFCFGPGVFFLFADRFSRLRPKNLDAPATAG